VDRLRLSVTDRCDLRCSYCMPRCGVTKVPRENLLTLEEMARVTSILVRTFGIRAVRLTGGEPLVRSGIERLVSMIAALGVDDLALTTNAQRLAGMARELAERGLDRVNVSLDTLDADGFGELTGGGDLARTLRGIDAALEAGLRPVKINVVALRGVNDSELVHIARHGLERGCEVRFLELMPIGVAGPPHGRLFVPASEIMASLSEAFELEPEPPVPGSTARTFAVPGGRIGLVTPETEPFCETCGRIRLTTDGRLLGCLHEEGGVALGPHLRRAGGPDDGAVERAIRDAIAAKPACRVGLRRSPMHAVGG
jgi:cyclic pyranopterin phosphate synthase